MILLKELSLQGITASILRGMYVLIQRTMLRLRRGRVSEEETMDYDANYIFIYL
jgi:hypothetical protein